ncbi:hypothetical protein, partial [Streptomyces sp. URMC 123]|uniref:hypothetical protein n=1 Tax=Streptomyces sp. URMC 123 TaxID=3423403 RepID=UPI003F19466A
AGGGAAAALTATVLTPGLMLAPSSTRPHRVGDGGNSHLEAPPSARPVEPGAQGPVVEPFPRDPARDPYTRPDVLLYFDRESETGYDLDANTPRRTLGPGVDLRSARVGDSTVRLQVHRGQVWTADSDGTSLSECLRRLLRVPTEDRRFVVDTGRATAGRLCFATTEGRLAGAVWEDDRDARFLRVRVTLW